MASSAEERSTDPRQAALNNAGNAGELNDLALAIACGLVYVGDQIASARWLVEQDKVAGAQVSKAVKVVALTARTVLLEVDGAQHQLYAGGTLVVPGFEGPVDAEVIDERGLVEVAEPKLPTAEARLQEVGDGAAVFSVGGRVFQVSLGDQFELVFDSLGRANLLMWGEAVRYRAFLLDQAAQIPEGLVTAARELVDALHGRTISAEVHEAAASLTDWLNQLKNVREEAVDERTSE